MSYDRFIKAVNLQPVDRVPANEWLDHPEFVKELTGIPIHHFVKVNTYFLTYNILTIYFIILHKQKGYY